MSIESTLYDTLRNDASVAAIVSTRIFPNLAPQNAAVPYVTYQLISTVPHNLLKGAAPSERKVFQVNCISNTYLQAKSIAEAAKTAINGTVGYCVGEGDDYFEQTQNHRVRLDVSLIG